MKRHKASESTWWLAIEQVPSGPKTRSRVGKSPWAFRLSLCLVDFTAMVFRHVLLAASFFGTAGNELGQQILASSTLKFAFFGKW